MLLKVDCEYLRRTLPLNKESHNIKKLYQESVEALKMVSLSKTSFDKISTGKSEV